MKSAVKKFMIGKTGIITAVIIIFIISTFDDAHGIVFTDREFVLNPLERDISNIGQAEFKPFGVSGFYAEFANYIQGTNSDFDHFWKGKMSGFIELFRIGNAMDLYISGDTEMIADPLGEIHFFPRSIFWTEDIIFSEKEPLFTWQTGFYQRCKHDIDNYNLYFTEDTVEERDLIYDSIPLRIISAPLNLSLSGDNSLRMSSLFYIKNDFYVILQDSWLLMPTPLSNQSTAGKLSMEGANDINTLIDSITAGLHNKFSFPENFGSYLNAQVVFDFYGKNGGWTERFEELGHINIDWMIETGIYLQTENRFCLYLSIERQQDTLIHPYPEDSLLVYVGIKILDPASYL